MRTIGFGKGAAPLALLLGLSSAFGRTSAIELPDSLVPLRGTVSLNQPIAVYNNWSAYDELSDNIELTEKLAMKELGQIVRLRRAGVRNPVDGVMIARIRTDETLADFEGGVRNLVHDLEVRGPAIPTLLAIQEDAGVEDDVHS